MYSQNLEEQHILNYFGDRIGTFIDIGCNNCVTFSNTRALALKGWSGVFVDPSEKAIQNCRELYKDYKKQFYVYPVAISSHNGKAILNESGPLINKEDVALVSTFHESEMQRFRRTVNYSQIEVKTFRWKTFLNRLSIKEFDFVSIDCEGSDIEILSQMDLTNTQMICVEWNSVEDVRKEIMYYTSKFGLEKVIYTSGENLLICK